MSESLQWRYCDAHGTGTEYAWGCPECVREMRKEIATLRAQLAAAEENEMTKEIEVIDQYNARHRFPVEGHYYEWRLKPGTIDVEGTDFLDVFRRYKDDEDEFEVIATFPRPARVGIVTDATCLALPMRELQMEQCPRCGYVTRPTAEKLK